MYWRFEDETLLDHGLRALERQFIETGFQPCDTPLLENGYEIVSI